MFIHTYCWLAKGMYNPNFEPSLEGKFFHKENISTQLFMHDMSSLYLLWDWFKNTPLHILLVFNSPLCLDNHSMDSRSKAMIRMNYWI
jgi:hypothetical protein